MCRGLCRPDMLDPPGSGVTGSCKSPTWVLGMELNGSLQEQSTFSTAKPFSSPKLPFWVLLRLASLYLRLALSLLYRLGWPMSAMIKGVLHQLWIQ